jgi:hypothetical protein
MSFELESEDLLLKNDDFAQNLSDKEIKEYPWDERWLNGFILIYLFYSRRGV